jgi:cyclohexadieny/prephenate dehydrogenase
VTETSNGVQSCALIGLGLIGSSLARAVKKHSPEIQITAFDLNPDFTRFAHETGMIDIMAESPVAAAQSAELTVLCTPLGSYTEIAEQILPHMPKGSILSDVGSVKGSVIQALTPLLPLNPDVIFIPGHPVAGTERSGVTAGFAELFENRAVIFTPLEDTPDAALEKLSDFWKKTGAKIEVMDAARHDLVFAVVSHLPHLIAYNIVGTAAHLEKVTESEVIRFSASGFRDFTRLAASDPTVWRDVFLHNREAVIEILGRFTEDLFDLQRAIRYSDGKKLFDLFSHTRKIRKEIIEAGQDTDKPNFGRSP